MAVRIFYYAEGAIPFELIYAPVFDEGCNWDTGHADRWRLVLWRSDTLPDGIRAELTADAFTTLEGEFAVIRQRGEEKWVAWDGKSRLTVAEDFAKLERVRPWLLQQDND